MIIPGYKRRDDSSFNPENPMPEAGPIEPRDRAVKKLNWLKWTLFLLVIIYVSLSQYSAPLLTGLGRYLVLAHPPQKSDLIVCLAGGNVERGLESADAYRKGLAPRILVTREAPPDGYELLRERGLHYPETVDLLVMILRGLGVPESALLISDEHVRSTFDEAKLVKDILNKKGFRSLILITSPTHSRSAWLTFKKVIDNKDIRILVAPTPYSGFRPEDWWKKRRYIRDVVIEYEKLIYYYFKYFL